MLDELNNEGQSPLTLASQLKREEILKFLEEFVSRSKHIYDRKKKKKYSLIELRLALARNQYEIKKEFESKILANTKKAVPINKNTFEKKNYIPILPSKIGKNKKKSSEYRRVILSSSKEVIPNSSEDFSLIEIPAEIKMKVDISAESLIADIIPNETSLMEKKDTSLLTPVKRISIILNDDVSKIMKILIQSGHKAYLVGGCIRDYLLGLSPVDYDIITNAPKNVLQENIRIGVFSKYIENLYKINLPNNINIDIIFVLDLDLNEDAKKRDFTCNALYLDINNDLYDPLLSGGFKDTIERNIKVIGDPYNRFLEDPIRLFRLVRLVGGLNFIIPQEISILIDKIRYTIKIDNPGKLFHEMCKLFLRGFAVKNYDVLVKLKLLPILFENLSEKLYENYDFHVWVVKKLEQTDIMVKLKYPVSPYYVKTLFQNYTYYLDINNQSFYKENIYQNRYSFFRETSIIGEHLIDQDPNQIVSASK